MSIKSHPLYLVSILVILMGLLSGAAQAAPPAPAAVEPHTQPGEKPAPAVAPAQAASDDGQVVGFPFLIRFPLANEPSNDAPAVAYNPQRKEYLVVWHRLQPVYPDIQAQRVAWDGLLVGNPFFIAGGAGAKRTVPDIVFNTIQNEYLVVWQHEADGARPDIHARRISGEGQLLGNEFALGTGGALRSRYTPAVAYASTANKYMAVWESFVQGGQSSDIEAQVISPSGVLEGVNFLIAMGDNNHSYTEPDIGYNRSRNEYLVAWKWDNKAFPNYDIKGRIVTRDGILLGSEVIIGYHTTPESKPAVIGMPTIPDYGKYLVAWQLNYSATDFDIYAREICGDGTPAPIYIVAGSSDKEGEPAVAAREGRDEYLTLWTFQSATSQNEIQGRIYQPAGPVAPTYALTGGALNPASPELAAGPDGSFLVVFSAGATDPRFIAGRLWGAARKLNVTATAGGTVFSQPAGIVCGSLCSIDLLAGTSVTLTAQPGSGWRFAGWGGACSGGQLTCQVTLDAAKTVTASFTPDTYTLTVAKSGSGKVSSNPPGIDCGVDCSETYGAGTSVTLTALPSAGWRFVKWSGDCSGAAPACTLAMTANHSAHASFGRLTLYLPCLMK